MRIDNSLSKPTLLECQTTERKLEFGADCGGNLKKQENFPRRIPG